jgi:hypothetical protein
MTAMTMNNQSDQSQSQLDKFKQAAKELEADEDEARWDEKLAKVAKAKPNPPKDD